ncbi:MAG: thiamine phosphate synthase [candidate division WOR-3 bacterium]
MKKLGPLYGIAGTDIIKDNFFYKIERAILGGLNVFQLREKGKDKKEIISIAKEVKKICDAYNCVFIINDDPYIAKEVDADGVHLGKYDIEIEKAREIVGKNKIIGISCYDSLERAIEAERKGADYVSFSSPFPSPTKPLKPLTDWERVEEAVKILKIPVYLIGGINNQNIKEVFKIKIYGICSISYIFNAEDPFFKAFELKELIYSSFAFNL